MMLRGQYDYTTHLIHLVSEWFYGYLSISVLSLITVCRKESFPNKESDTTIYQSIYFVY